MIRINLLDHMPAPTERLQAMLNPSRSGGFISRRETVLGGLFLLLAFTILGTQLWLSQEPEEEIPPAEEVAKRPDYGAEFKMGRGASNPFAPKKASPAAVPKATPPEPAEPKAVTPPAKAAPPPAEPKPAASKPAEPKEQDDPPATRAAMTGIRVTPLEDGVDVFLPIEGRPRVRSFRVDSPNRVVFDIPGAILEAPRDQRNQRVDSVWATRVRAAQNSVEPPLVRVVLEVPQFPSINHFVSDAGVAIRVRQP